MRYNTSLFEVDTSTSLCGLDTSVFGMDTSYRICNITSLCDIVFYYLGWILHYVVWILQYFVLILHI